MPGPRLRLLFNATLLGEADSLTVRQPGWELQIHGPPNPHTPYPMSLGLRGQPFADLQRAGLLSLELLQVGTVVRAALACVCLCVCDVTHLWGHTQPPQPPPPSLCR